MCTALRKAHLSLFLINTPILGPTPLSQCIARRWSLRCVGLENLSFLLKAHPISSYSPFPFHDVSYRQCRPYPSLICFTIKTRINDLAIITFEFTLFNTFSINILLRIYKIVPSKVDTPIAQLREIKKKHHKTEMSHRNQTSAERMEK